MRTRENYRGKDICVSSDESTICVSVIAAFQNCYIRSLAHTSAPARQAQDDHRNNAAYSEQAMADLSGGIQLRQSKYFYSLEG